MIPSEIASYYDGLSKENRLKFLTVLAHEITIVSRGCYSIVPQVVSSDSVSPVGSLNEIQHVIIGYITNMICDENDYTSGDIVVYAMLYWRTPLILESEMMTVLRSAVSRVTNKM